MTPEGGTMSFMIRPFRKHCLAVIAVAAVAFGILGSGVASADTNYPLAGASSCADVDIVVQPSNILSRVRAERAALCLVNAERAARGLAPLKRYIALRGSRIRGLQGAATQHASESAASPWWGTKDEQGNERSAHVNPYTGSTPETRIRASLYCLGRTIASLGENAYWGAGSSSTPRAAVGWWMQSQLHRDAILNAQFKDTGVAVVYGSANPEWASYNPSATFVETFATCT
jgi:uncharacterized protein YkwD